MPERPVVAFVQPYVPDYRVALFDELSRQLALQGMELQVWHGKPAAETAKKGNARTGSWSVLVPQLRLHFGNKVLGFRLIQRRARRAMAVVVPFSAGTIEAYPLMLGAKRHVFLWGHGKSYVSHENRLVRALKGLLARRATGVFVYTPSGENYVRSLGVHPSRVRTVFNSTDTTSLRASKEAIDQREIESLKESLNICDGPVGLFVGAFHESKRLDFLFESIDLIRFVIPTFTAVIAGAGVLNDYVEQQTQLREFVRQVPRVSADDFAKLSTVADVLLMPGRVGLVAVDAVALGLPVLTTKWPFHAPEAEYLTAENSIWADDSVSDYADAAIGLLNDELSLSQLKQSTWESGAELTVERTAHNFVELIKSHSAASNQ